MKTVDNHLIVLLESIVSAVWGPATVFVFLAVGLYFTAGTGFLQLRRPGLWLFLPLKTFFGRDGKANKGTLCTVLAATAGTGNIAGVATALAAGGPGAVFWMWVSAFLGMALGYAENILGTRYRYRSNSCSWTGGAPVYMERGLKSKPLAVLFSVCCALAAFGIGNLVQGNSMVSGIESVLHSVGMPTGKLPALVIGAVTALAAAPAILGGAGKIAGVTAKTVPMMVISYLAGSAVIIAVNYKEIVPSLTEILGEAFNFKAGASGIAGYGIAVAMRTGLSRGLLSHEAGMGSSVAVHATAEGNNPIAQGLWSMFEVFIDTIVVCTVTALVIMTSGVYDKAAYAAGAAGLPDGAALTSAAFATVLGTTGKMFVAASLAVFAFSTILGWGCFGERAACRVTGGRTMIYKIIYVAVIPLGCVMEMRACWLASDILNWLMAVPNLLAITFLSGTVFRISRENTNKISRRLSAAEKDGKKYGTKKSSGNT